MIQSFRQQAPTPRRWILFFPLPYGDTLFLDSSLKGAAARAKIQVLTSQYFRILLHYINIQSIHSREILDVQSKLRTRNAGVLYD
jgi:hypothetical protein